MKNKVALLLLTWLLLASCSVYATDATLIANTYISKSSPSTNYCNDQTLHTGGNAISLLQFDLSSLPAGTTATNVARANLILFLHSVTTPGAIQLYLVDRSWSPCTVTYHTAPTMLSPAFAEVPIEAGTSNDFLVVDVTTQVQNWLDAPNSNDGIAILAATTSPSTTVQFDNKASTGTSHPARLDITLANGVPGPQGPQGLEGPPGPAPNVSQFAQLGAANNYSANQTIGGNLSITGAGNGITFPDGTTQTTAAPTVPSGTLILGTSSTAPAGYMVFTSMLQPGTGALNPQGPSTYAFTCGATDGSKLYASCETAFSSYDPVAQSWSPLAAPPMASTYGAMAYLNGNVYLMDGQVCNASGCSYVTSVYVYNVSSGTWSPVAANSTGREYPQAVALNGKIYLIGGQINNGAGDTGSVEVYDPTSNTWSGAASLNNPRASFGAVAYNGKIYVAGGCTANAGCPSNSVEIYDPTSNTWTAGPALPQGLTYSFAAAYNGGIYAIGYNNGQTVVEVLNLATNTWSIPGVLGPSMNMSWAGAMNGQLYSLAWLQGPVGQVFQFVPPTTLYFYMKN